MSVSQFYKIYNDAYRRYLDGQCICEVMTYILSCISPDFPCYIGRYVNGVLCMDASLRDPVMVDVCGEIVSYNDASVCILCKFNGNITGVVVIGYVQKDTEYFMLISALMGTLQNNCNNYNPKQKQHVLNKLPHRIVVYDVVRNLVFSSDVCSASDIDCAKKILDSGNKIYLYSDKKINRNNMCYTLNTIIYCDKMYYTVLIEEKMKNTNNKNTIAILSHELRNPLQSISLACHLLVNQLNIKNCYLTTVSRSCNEMKKIINDILDLSKLEKNELVIELDIINISGFVNDLNEEYTRIFECNKNIGLKMEIMHGVPETLMTDDTRLYQILTNLLNNAIKYTKNGTVKLLVDYVDDYKNNQCVSFSVVDSGVGIPAKELCDLFTPNCQMSNSDKFNSNGLGLYISQMISGLLGGEISVSSGCGGSIFTFFHPIKLSCSHVFKNTYSEAKSLCGKILIVDDNVSNLDLFRDLLCNMNYDSLYSLDVHAVGDGLSAIDLCKLNKYNVIFMDINMPNIDGGFAGKIIKQNGYGGYIIATTGNILAQNDKTHDKFKYFDDTLIKPFDHASVIKMLGKYLI